MSRLTPAIRLLILSIAATAFSALLGMYLVLQAAVMHAGEGAPLRNVAASVVDLGLMVLAAYVLNKASQSPSDGGPFLPRGRRLLKIWAILTALLLVFLVVTELLALRSS